MTIGATRVTAFALSSAMFAVTFIEPAVAGEFDWNTLSGTFQTSRNWLLTSGSGTAPPGPGDTARFDVGGIYNVDFTADVTNNLLSLDSGIITLRTGVAIAPTYTLSGASADAFVSGATVYLGASGQPLNLVIDDQLVVNDGGALYVQPFSVLTAHQLGIANSIASVSDGDVIVTGVLPNDEFIDMFNIVNDGSVINGIGNYGNGSLVITDMAQGSVDGLLRIATAGFLAAGSGALEVRDGALLVTESIEAGGGTNAGGTILVDGGAPEDANLWLSGTSSLTLGGPLGTDGPGTLTLTNGGTFLSGTGSITVNETGLIEVLDSAAPFTTLTLQGPILIDSGEIRVDESGFAAFNHIGNVPLTVQNSGRLDLLGNRTINDGQVYTIASSSEFRVTGELTVGNTTDGTLIIQDPETTLTNFGGITIGDFGGEGSMTIRDNAALTLGDITVAPDGPGTLSVESSSFVTVNDLVICGTDLEGPGEVTVTGAGSEISQPDDAVLSVGCPGADSTATLNLLDGGVFDTGGAASTSVVTVGQYGLVNIDGGTFQAECDVDVLGGGVIDCVSGSIDVHRVLTLFPGATLFVDGTMTFLGTGTMDLQGGTIGGSGVIDLNFPIATTLPSFSDLSPGRSIGVLGIVNGQWAQLPSSEVQIELAGSGGVPGVDHDQLVFSDSATLAGTLVVSLLDGFTPSTGDEFEIITTPFVGGLFDDYMGPDNLEVVYEQTRVLLRAVCRADIAEGGDGQVGIEDLLDVLAAWGPCPGGTDPCPADVNGDTVVDILDLLDVLAAWGPCP